MNKEQIIKSGRDCGDYWSSDEELIEYYNESICFCKDNIVENINKPAFSKVRDSMILELKYFSNLIYSE